MGDLVVILEHLVVKMSVLVVKNGGELQSLKKKGKVIW